MILNIKKSFIFTTLALSAHVGALLLSFVLPIAIWQKIVIVALIGTSLWWQTRYGIWAWMGEIKLQEDGTCIRTANAVQSRYRITQATAHVGFVRLNLTGIGEPNCIQLVSRDAVESEVYRNLLALIVQRRLLASDKTSA